MRETPTRSHEGDDRAVSEVLGYALTFSIIVLTIGVVFASGFTNLQSTRDAERIDNAGRAFDVLAENLKDIAQRGAPNRATEIKLADARLTTDDDIVLNVTGDFSTGSTDPGRDFTSSNVTISPIVYDSGEGTRFRYLSGAIIRNQEAGAVMLRDPDFVLKDDEILIRVIRTDTGRTGDIAGSLTALVRTDRRQVRLVQDFEQTGTYDEVTVNVTTPTPSVWRAFFEDQGLSCTEQGAGRLVTVSCDGTDIERVYVSVITVSVDYES